MNYNETVNWLFNCLPVFQHRGPGAYKPGLTTARRLDDAFGNPSRGFSSVHIAGTNGKGSTAHSLAAVLQQTGYKTGLYTSPHLTDFRERIRINGEKITEEKVIDFVRRYKEMDLGCEPSFFELTTIMAFEYFADEKVDVAIIETGLGGRLDTTNIITPLLSVITNISKDHTSLLGDTPAAIAGEKAGIIKEGVPVVIGEADDDAVRKVFTDKASETHSPIIFATPVDAEITDAGIIYRNTPFGTFKGELRGEYQVKNMATILAALSELRSHFKFSDTDVATALGNVTGLTGLTGRWMTVSTSPLTVCDTGHNEGGWEYITRQLSHHNGTVHLIMGFVADKDTSHILEMVRGLKNAKLYFTSPVGERRLDENELKARACDAGIEGEAYTTLREAMEAAKEQFADGDMIFVGGSNFLVSELFQ